MAASGEVNDPACFLPEGSESLFHYIEADLKTDSEELVTGEDNVFLNAAEKGKTELVLKILGNDSGMINCKDCDGYSALHRASYNGHVEIVRVLLQYGADVLSVTENHWQPLHCACRWDQTEVASFLLQNGADINAQTCGGQTPLHLAVTYCRENSLLEVLLLHRLLDPSIVNCQNESALDLAKRYGKSALFELIESSVNIQW